MCPILISLCASHRAGVAVIAVVDLDEPDAALDQPAGRQARLAEGARGVLVEPVEPARRLALRLETQDLRNGHLHVECEFVRLDPRAHGGVLGILDGGQAVQAPDETELLLLLLPVHLCGGCREGERIGRIDPQGNAAMLGAEVVGVVGPHAAAAVRRSVAEHDELREVIVQRAQPVVRPRADRGEVAFELEAAGVKLQLRAVVVVGGPHRADDGHVVDALAHVRPPVADLDSALPPLPVADLHRVEPRLAVARSS